MQIQFYECNQSQQPKQANFAAKSTDKDFFHLSTHLGYPQRSPQDCYPHCSDHFERYYQ